jgi:hypothetical protein
VSVGVGGCEQEGRRGSDIQIALKKDGEGNSQGFCDDASLSVPLSISSPVPVEVLIDDPVETQPKFILVMHQTALLFE